jgi:hypothetical protein
MASEPSFALASLIDFLLTSIDYTTPILKLSRIGMQRGVPIFKTPSVTLTPITIGLFALKHASFTIYIQNFNKNALLTSRMQGNTASLPYSPFLDSLHYST